MDIAVLDAIQQHLRTPLLDQIMLLATHLGDLALVWRARPFVAYEFAGLLIPPPSGDSFPSNHSMVSFAAAAALCCLPGKGRGVLALKVSAVAVACLIAFSRLYLYVHYPSDILAGAVIGIAVGIGSVWLVEKTWPESSSD